MLGDSFKKFTHLEIPSVHWSNKGSEKSCRKEMFDIVERPMGNSYWYNSYTSGNTSLQKNKFIEKGFSVWAETILWTHFVWVASIFRSILANTMQLGTWDFPQAGGILPWCPCGEWEGRLEYKEKTMSGRKGDSRRDPGHPGKPRLLLGLGLLIPCSRSAAAGSFNVNSGCWPLIPCFPKALSHFDTCAITLLLTLSRWSIKEASEERGWIQVPISTQVQVHLF